MPTELFPDPTLEHVADDINGWSFTNGFPHFGPTDGTGPGIQADNTFDDDSAQLAGADNDAFAANTTTGVVYDVAITVSNFTSGATSPFGVLIRDGDPAAFDPTGNGVFHVSVTAGPYDVGFAFLIQANGGSGATFDITNISVPEEGGSTQDLTPPLTTNATIFYGPTITAGAVTVAPALLTNGQTFFGPTVSPGAVIIEPPILPSAEAFFGPALATGSVDVAPPLISNEQAFYEPEVTEGAVVLAPPLLASENAFYAPVLSVGEVSVSPTLLSSATTFFAATVTTGAVSVAPVLVTNGAVFFAPYVIPGEVTLAPPLHANDNVFFAPRVLFPQFLSPSLLVDADSFFGGRVALRLPVPPSRRAAGDPRPSRHIVTAVTSRAASG